VKSLPSQSYERPVLLRISFVQRNIIDYQQEQGNADGQCCFGLCLENGRGVAQDLVRAGEYYRLSARTRKCCRSGFTLDFVLRKVVVLLKISLVQQNVIVYQQEQGNADGQFNFAVCLENGAGIRTDLAMARPFDQGMTEAHDCYQRC
jgi:hypothetical protein